MQIQTYVFVILRLEVVELIGYVRFRLLFRAKVFASGLKIVTESYMAQKENMEL